MWIAEGQNLGKVKRWKPQPRQRRPHHRLHGSGLCRLIPGMSEHAMNSVQQLADQLIEQVVRWYNVPRGAVQVVFAPYRICPLGAHIDHQWGRVTAMALDRGVLLAFAPQDRPELALRSCDFEGEVRVALDTQVPPAQPGDWGNYIRGAVRALQQDHQLPRGLVGVTAGRVAEGGLSSSAAVGVAYLLALEHVNQLQVTPQRNIALVQHIENEYLGLRIGILDQSAILLSRRGALTEIDCGQITHQLHPRPATMPRFAILIVFSGLRKALVSTDYNLRVSECAEAARTLLAAAGQGQVQPLLGNVSPAQYAEHRHCLSGPPARCAVAFLFRDAACEGWRARVRAGDLSMFGRLVTESGRSSIENYECGAPPLIDLYHTLVDTPGVYGARFSGAGFRGCCLALVDDQRAEQIAAEVIRQYQQQHPDLARQAWSMPCQDGDQARIL